MEDPSCEGRGLSPAESIRDIGPRKAGREWLCGGRNSGTSPRAGEPLESDIGGILWRRTTRDEWESSRSVAARFASGSEACSHAAGAWSPGLTGFTNVSPTFENKMRVQVMGDGSSDKARIFQQQFHWREWVASGTAELIVRSLRDVVTTEGPTRTPGIMSALVNHEFENLYPNGQLIRND